MKTDFKKVFAILHENQKNCIILIAFGIIAYTFSYFLEFCIRYLLIIKDPTNSQFEFELLLSVTYFIKFFTWYFLFAGAVFFSGELFDKEHVKFSTFFTIYKNKKYLKKVLVYAFIFACITTIPLAFEKTIVNNIPLPIVQSGADIINPNRSLYKIILFLLYCGETYALYRMTFVPFVFNNKNKFGECIILSHCMTKKFKYVIKYWLLIDFSPSVVAILFAAILNYFLLQYINASDWPMFLAASFDEFYSWVINIVLGVFLPLKLIGYQMCKHNLILTQNSIKEH